MLTALRVTTNQTQQIADYVTNYAVSATAERKLKIAAHAEAKVLHVVRAILTEIQEAALASTKTELRKTIRAKTTFCCTMGQQIILTNILKTELEIDYTVYSHLPAANSSDDTLVEQAANYHPRYMYTLDVSWFTDNPHVQGTLGVPFNYSIADHLNTEWNALKKGIGTDLRVTVKNGTDAPFMLHHSKLLMHSEYFATMNEGTFVDSENLKQKKLELDPNDCTLATFKHLVEFMYRGKIDEQKLTSHEWIAVYNAADIYGMQRARELALFEIQKLIGHKQVGNELMQLLNRAVIAGHNTAIQLCFDAIDEKTEAALIGMVDAKNWHALYEAAQKHPKIRELLQNCRKFNPRLMDLPLEAPKAPAPAPVAASASSSSAAAAALPLE